MAAEEIFPAANVSTPPAAIPVATPAQVEDEEIYCPICNYNLTGVHSGRCPECGSLFHREALLAAQKANQVTLIPWDDPQRVLIFERLWPTLRICLFKPERFAFAFSVQPQSTRAGSFFFGVLAVTCVLAACGPAASILFDPRWPGNKVTDVFEVGMAAAVFTACLIAGTTLGAGILLGLTSPHYDGKHHLRPWLSICAYASAHYLMAGVLLPLAVLGSMVDAMIFVGLGILVLFACGLLCALTLHAVMRHRTAADRQRSIVYVLLIAVHVVVPFIALAFTGVVISVFETLF